MMTLLKVRGISKSFIDKQILKDINFEINKKDRIGLVGSNGCGKTTLANILFGNLEQDDGTIEMPNGTVKIGYLLQSIDYTINHFHSLLSRIEDPDLLTHSRQLGLQKVYEWEDDRIKHLSGGEKLKLALAQIWASKPDMLILDEPTNHLDFIGIKWLIGQLRAYEGPVIIISHDRLFLDETVKSIYEIEDCKLNKYEGNYTEYKEEKIRLREVQAHQYTIQQNYKRKIQDQMVNLRKWSDKAHRESTKQGTPSERKQIGFKEYHRVKAKKMDIQIKSKMKRLEMELEKNKIEKPKEEAKVLFQFDSSGKRGKRVVEANRMSKSFENLNVFTDSNFYIKHGERVGIIGENGAGKTTLIKMLTGEESVTDGELWISQSLKTAYLSQDVHDLPSNQLVIEALQLTTRESIYQARTILANLGLKEEKINQKINSLSLGERIRVKLTDILLKDYDILVLDEPTNHLDLPSREKLEETLCEFTGTIIIVSHDYYFLEKISNKLLVFEDKKIKRVETGLQEYRKSTQKRESNKQIREEQLMIINNRITAILGELSLLVPSDERYKKLDKEYKNLIVQKRTLLG